jgi:hypothetical protein
MSHSPPDPLTKARAEIDALLDSLRHDLDAAAAARDAELAAAAEQLTQDRAVQAAYRQAQAAERLRVQRLISLQLEHLAPCSAARTVLHTLSRMVEAPE